MAYMIFCVFPSFSFLGLFILEIHHRLFGDKIEKQFEEIVKEEEDKELLNVAIFDDKAYWVCENVFYEAEIVNNEINRESSKPVDTMSMSPYDVNKMLFILDHLKEG
jgi:hypothetical protein